MAQFLIDHNGDRRWAAIANWASSPGGLYNIGNGLGLVSGVTLAVLPVSASVAGNSEAVFGAIANYFVGDIAAVALSLAMFIFFYSGFQYDRAWAKGAPPDPAFNRSGDVWSGIGALLLGVGLLALGQPVLAATAGLLHAIGKFGSAWFSNIRCPGWKKTWPDLWRTTVLISRIPAMLAAIIAIITSLRVTSGTDLAAGLAPSLTLLACYILWVWADLKLFKS